MSTALLLIDLQKDYFPGGLMELSGIDAASAKAAALLSAFRKSKQPLVHVRHVFGDAAAPFFRPDSTGIEIHESVEPAGGELVITKAAVNAFQGTDLQSRLSALGIKRLVIGGAMSHMCIEGTTRAAADLDYECEVIHDACATCDQQFADRTIAAADVHGTAMATLGFGYAKVGSLADWQRENG